MSDIEYDDYGEEIPKVPKYLRPKIVCPDRRNIFLKLKWSITKDVLKISKIKKEL